MRAKFFAISLLLLCSLSLAYKTSIEAPAVIENENVGILTQITLNITLGSGGVFISGPAQVGQSTLQSAQAAASAASSYVGVSESRYNFNYTFSNSTNVSGPSGGLALALLAISGIQRQQLISRFTATGTINTSGAVGPVGGVYDKAFAAKNRSLSFILVPSQPRTSFESLIYYVAQQALGISVVPVSNLSGAVPYAFGRAPAKPTSVNISAEYHASKIASYSASCSSCNFSAFTILANSTFEFVNGTEQNISPKFSAARQQLLSNLQQYRELAGKGYVYTGADFAFLDFSSAFALANAQNITLSSTQNLIDNVSLYCSSVAAPQLTDANYEYIIGGSLRLIWANITIQNAQKLLNSSQTTDDFIETAYVLAPALAWCKGASYMYNAGLLLNGNSIGFAPSVRSATAAAIASASTSGSTLYLLSAERAYTDKDYATALYATAYSKAFGSSPRINATQLPEATLSNIANATQGVWPAEFSAQAAFYLSEASLSNASAASSYTSQAYSTSLLAKGLSSTNLMLQKAFIANETSLTPGSASQISSELAALHRSVTEIYTILLIETIVLLVVLIALVVLLLQSRQPKAAETISAPAPRRTRKRK